jgi:hypothetical protein
VATTAVQSRCRPGSGHRRPRGGPGRKGAHGLHRHFGEIDPGDLQLERPGVGPGEEEEEEEVVVDERREVGRFGCHLASSTSETTTSG